MLEGATNQGVKLSAYLWLANGRQWNGVPEGDWDDGTGSASLRLNRLLLDGQELVAGLNPEDIGTLG